MSFERGGVWVNPLAVTHGISDVNLVEWATLFLASKEHLHHQTALHSGAIRELRAAWQDPTVPTERLER